MRNTAALLLFVLASPSMAEISNRMALQGAVDEARKILVMIDSDRACEVGHSMATVFALAPDGTRMWDGQNCEIKSDGGKLQLACTSSADVASPIAAAIYREAEPGSDGSCTYRCIAGCDQGAPALLHSTTPIMFAPPPPPSPKVDLVLSSCATLNQFNGRVQFWPQYAAANAMLLASFPDDRQILLEKLHKIWKKTVATCRQDPNSAFAGKLMQSAMKYAKHPPR